MPESLKLISLFKEDYLITDLHSDDIQVNKYLYQYNAFDKYGNLLTEIKYTPEGDVEEKIERSYDAQGNLIEEIYYVSEEEESERRTFERDGDGKIRKEFKHYLDGSIDTVYYFYDEMGHLIKKQTLDEEEQVEGSMVYEYQQDQLVAQLELDEEGNPVSEKKVRLNETGHPVEQIEWNKADHSHLKIIDEYDATGKRIVSLRYINDRLVSRSGYEEDEQGRIVRITEESNQGTSALELTYDERNNVTLQEEFDRGGELLSRVERKFDGNDRPLESQVFVNGMQLRMNQKYTLKYEYELYE